MTVTGIVWRHRWCWEGQYLRPSHDQLDVRAWRWRSVRLLFFY
jgi:hypothetical protein